MDNILHNIHKNEPVHSDKIHDYEQLHYQSDYLQNVPSMNFVGHICLVGMSLMFQDGVLQSLVLFLLHVIVDKGLGEA